MEGKKTIILTNGQVFPVIGEKGNYWICKKTKFRKGNPHIAEIKVSALKKEEPKEEE